MPNWLAGPGVKKENISVRIDGNLVQIDAETKDEDGVLTLELPKKVGSTSKRLTVH